MSTDAPDIIAEHVINPGGQHDGWWACMCGEPWTGEHVLTALTGAGYQVSKMNRVYALGYRINGDLKVVTGHDGPTEDRRRVESDIERLHEELAVDCYRLAFMDTWSGSTDWREVNS